jgi:hypothetical protein
MGEDVTLETEDPRSKIFRHDVSLRMFQGKENTRLRRILEHNTDY